MAAPTIAQGERIVYATTQRFEHGQMIWRADTSLIWVLVDGGTGFIFPANAYTNLPDNPIISKPDGTPARLRPILGMGKIWGNIASVRDQLGWPIGPEIGFSMAVRSDTDTYYLSQLDNTIIQITSSGAWRRFANPSEARILSLAASPNLARYGDDISVMWETSGAEMAIVEIYDANENARYAVYTDLPASGSVDIPVPATASAQLTIVVWAANKIFTEDGLYHTYQRLVFESVPLDIDTANIIGSTVQIAYQPFQHGFMIWRADTETIYVFYNDLDGGTYSAWEKAEYAAWPDNSDSAAPPGLIAPILGFGKVWQHEPNVQRGLGHATIWEQKYSTNIVTQDGELLSLTLLDGRVIQLVDAYNWVVY